MSLIDRYVFKLTNFSIMAVVTCLLFLTTLFSLFEELNESDLNYGLFQVASYILGTTPKRLHELLIYSVFLGLLISLGRLAESNELTIIRASGWSPSRILKSLMPTLFIWLAISLFISEYLLPKSEKQAEIEKLQTLHGENPLKKSGGLWFKDKNLYMQINAFGNQENIFGITQYWLNKNQRLTNISYAESAIYDAERSLWTLIDVKETKFGNRQVTKGELNEKLWRNPITPDMLASQAFIEPKKMSVLELYRQMTFIEDQNIRNSQYSIAFWSRLLEPLAYISLAYYAIAILLGPLRQTSAGSRISVGIFSGLGFMYLKNLFSPMVSVFGLPAIIAVLLPIAVVYSVSTALIRRNA